MRFDLHHPANRRRPCIVVNPGRGDYVVAGVAVHPEERLLLFQDRNELTLALLVPRVILHRASVCPLVLLRRSSDSQTLGDGKNAFIRIDGDKSRLGNVMRQVPPEHDTNIAVNGPFRVEVANPENPFTAMLISRSRGTCLITCT